MGGLGHLPSDNAVLANLVYDGRLLLDGRVEEFGPIARIEIWEMD